MPAVMGDSIPLLRLHGNFVASVFQAHSSGLLAPKILPSPPGHRRATSGNQAPTVVCHNARGQQHVDRNHSTAVSASRVALCK